VPPNFKECCIRYSCTIFIPPLSEGGGGYTVLPLSVRPSVRPRYFSSHFSKQLLMTRIWYLVTSFIYACYIVGSVFGPVRFLLPVCRLCWFLCTLNIFSHIFLSNYWWQKSDIWSQASYYYRYPISWEAFFDPSDSYFLFAEERGYHKWALAHSSSC
jgi:hypothetical protein